MTITGVKLTFFSFTFILL